MNLNVVNVKGEHKYFYSSLVCTVKDLFSQETLLNDFYVIHCGKIAGSEEKLTNGGTYHFIPRLSGGKGGFGSMLRAIGAQIEKTTNREACRDLSGRRMRDINNEKKLREWMGKASERDQEKERKRQERRERRKSELEKHLFHNPTYDETKSKVLNDLDDALQEGISKVRAEKRKDKQPIDQPKAKKSRGGLLTFGLGMNSDSSGSDNEAKGQASNSVQLDSKVVSNDDLPGSSGMSAGANDYDRGDSSDSSTSDSDSEYSDNAVEEDEQSFAVAANKEKRTASEISSSVNVLHGDNLQDDKGAGCFSEHASTSSSLIVSSSSAGMTVTSTTDQSAAVLTEVDLDQYSSATELESLGLDVLKVALVSRGLKCGGTLKERSERLFAVKGLTPEQIDPSLCAKKLKK